MPVLGEWSTIRKLFYPETGFEEVSGLVMRSLSAVSEAPTREDLQFRCAVYGRFRYSDLKEAALRTMGFVWG